ncbi:MAG: hypothetical protein LEGION0398_MBIBDBAK_01186 [Legionellaceae bacterium]
MKMNKYFYAVRNNDITALNKLYFNRHTIKIGINNDINQIDDGLTPFLFAVRFSDIITLKWLVQHGADINKTLEKRNALYYVIFSHCGTSQQQREKLAYLLELGFAFDKPEFALILKENTSLLEEILNKKDFSLIKDKWGSGLLHYAAALNNIEAVKLILKKSTSFYYPDKIINATPLARAAINGHVDIIKQLLEENLLVTIITKENKNEALLYAAGGGHLNSIKCLIKDGYASVTSKNIIDKTPLLIAAENGHFDTVKWLLAEGGASVTEKDKFNETSLLLAAENSHIKIVNLLIEYGADVHISHDYTLRKAFNIEHLLIYEENPFKYISDFKPLLIAGNKNFNTEIVNKVNLSISKRVQTHNSNITSYNYNKNILLYLIFSWRHISAYLNTKDIKKCLLQQENNKKISIENILENYNTLDIDNVITSEEILTNYLVFNALNNCLSKNNLTLIPFEVFSIISSFFVFFENFHSKFARRIVLIGNLNYQINTYENSWFNKNSHKKSILIGLRNTFFKYPEISEERIIKVVEKYRPDIHSGFFSNRAGLLLNKIKEDKMDVSVTHYC